MDTPESTGAMGLGFFYGIEGFPVDFGNLHSGKMGSIPNTDEGTYFYFHVTLR